MTTTEGHQLRPPTPTSRQHPPPPFRLYAVHRRPGDRPTPYEMHIYEKCNQTDDPDLWEVEVRYIRRVNPVDNDG